MTATHHRAEADLPITVEAVPFARRFLDHHLTAWGQHRLAEDARLVLSELVTNAIRHAHKGGQLHIAIHGNGPGVLYIAVDDGADEPPVLRPLTGHQDGGRGLHIVEQLSRRWGTQRRDTGGKRVWAELPAVGRRPSAEPSHL